MTPTATPPQGYAGGCPVIGARAGAAGAATLPLPNGMPESSNAPQPGQNKPLSTWRQPSTIPMTEIGDLPLHQRSPPIKAGVWVYPSEQMFYNAMARKGWSPSEDDMPAVVAIHNAVNERVWREVRSWEEAAGNGDPRLLRFRGRPQDPSPKARLLNVLGYRLPFDRHDWVVLRPDGTEVRYVIDFYNGAPLPDMPMAVHLDVRPALDSPLALWRRLSRQTQWVASGRWRTE